MAGKEVVLALGGSKGRSIRSSVRTDVAGFCRLWKFGRIWVQWEIGCLFVVCLANNDYIVYSNHAFFLLNHIMMFCQSILDDQSSSSS